MTGRIIPFHGDLHDEMSTILPWYVTGQLDGDDQARVETHLKTCVQCQADLAIERRLHEEVFTLPEEPGFGDERGWAHMKAVMAAEDSPVRRGGVVRQWRDSAPWLRWAVAAQLLLLIIGGGTMFAMTHPSSPRAPSALYHALGAAPVTRAGNVVVVFRPEVRERDMRQILRSYHARLVDGPTAADAYILQVPAAERDHTLTELRQKAAIVLAEPIDSASGDAP